MSTSSPTILLVHENAEMRSFLDKQLPNRCRTCMAEGRKEALQYLRTAEPNLLIIDSKLGPRDRRALSKAAKQQNEFLSVLLLEGDDGGEHESGPGESFGPRADEILEKPFTAKAFRKQVERLLYEIPPAEDDSAESRSRHTKIAERALQVIEERLEDPDLTVGEVSEAVGVSRRHLSRQLKAAVGKTTAAVMRARRVEQAKKELQTGPDTIAEVAEAVGFRSPSHFSQVFRNQAGCTPTTFRQEHASPSA